MEKDFVEEMEREVARVQEYIPPVVILITADCGAGKFELARKLSRDLSIYLLSNDYVRNYFYQGVTDFSENTRLDIEDKVSKINKLRTDFLISHRISFVFDQNVHNLDSYKAINDRFYNSSFKQFKIRIHSDDNYNIKAISNRRMDYQSKDESVIGDNVFYVSSFSEDVYWEIKKRKEITLDDSWFDFVIYRTSDDVKFNKDIDNIVLKIRELMES